MSEQLPRRAQSFIAQLNEPLIAVHIEINGHEEIRYFVDEQAADEALKQTTKAQQAIKLAGAWSDLDADEVLDSLDRIRHECTPTPPIDNL